MKKLIYIFLLLTAVFSKTFAQYPQYFTYDNENGLPSNEVYSIVQDNKGFIWIGCDAGLFKFDGVRYISYKCKTQNSKSIAGLTISSSGKLYCHNFQSQLFCLDNDTLKELKNIHSNISGITVDKKGNIFVTHFNGISQYNESYKKWTNYNDFAPTKTSCSPKLSVKNEVHFLTESGIAILLAGKIHIDSSTYFQPVGTFIMENMNDEQFIFSHYQTVVYKVKNGKVSNLKNTQLFKVLQNRKVTNAVYLSDNNLWITTYKGSIKYNPKTEETELLYPEISFSNAMIDRENNYWFTTLQKGLIRIPNLNFSVWNKQNKHLENDEITKIATDNTNIYFATVNGTIGKLNSFTNQLQTFHTGQNADAQSLNYDFIEQRLYFNINKLLYLYGNSVKEQEMDFKSIKSIHKIKDDFVVLTSFGVYIKGKQNYKISDVWARELCFDKTSNTVWIATNKGVLKVVYKDKKWIVKENILPNVQILSIDFDEKLQQLFLLTFEGNIYLISGKIKALKIASLPNDVQANKLKYCNSQLFSATNKGVWIFDLATKKWSNLNVLSGLASDNVQDLLLLNGNLWLATGKGLQKIPINRIKEKPLAKIYLKNTPTKNIFLDYKQSFVLLPEVAHYSSKGQLEYAYSINQQDWVKLPASIEHIEIQNLPTGNFEIKLKAIDHLGRDSENTILLKGFVNPPFYKTWWFILLVFLFSLAIVYWIYQRQLTNQKQKIQQQNELNIAKLTAIRSQMNPHFIFNSLNSIQDLILQQKTIESYDYIVLFSELVRDTLNHSNKEFISIQQEIEFLNTYLQLEKLRFKDDFSYSIQYNHNDEINVPALLIQPFVENALLHGLLHKEGKKELFVKFLFENEQLICMIEDNGIGRKQAEIIRSRQGSANQSFAIDAIKKRLEIINEQQKQLIGKFIYEDVYPDQKNTGTRVIINLPYKLHY